VTATVITYASTDASAPVLTGAVGSVVALLDACLVNGYGSKSAAGWAKSFSGTNKATYRNSATDGTGFYLYVDDSAAGTGGAKEALWTGFQTQSALGVGTGQFPTFAQLGLGIGAVVCRKSTTADSTTRPWTLVADDTVFYLFVDAGDSTSAATACMFGDIYSYMSSDPYRCMIIGNNQQNTGSGTNLPFGHLSNYATSTLPGHFLAANINGAGGSLLCGKHSDTSKLGALGVGTVTGTSAIGTVNAALGFSSTALLYPSPVDGGLWLAPVWVHHNGIIRGYLKGLWCPLHQQPLGHYDTVSGSGVWSGKTFLSQYVSLNSGNANALIETSNTWS
jgi:hypothetical protein